VDRERLLKVLYVTIFLNSTGLGTSTFLLPVFAESLGASYTDLGIIGAVGNVAYTLITLFCGLLLDRFERTRLYLVFSVGSAFSVWLFAASTSITHVLLVRVLLGVFSASFWVTASTLTADISPKESLTKSMGRYNLSWITGFAFGPFVGGVISNNYGFKTLFITLGALSVLSSIIIIAFIQGKNEQQMSPEGWVGLGKLRSLFWSYVTLLPFTLVLGIYMAIMPGHMSVVGFSASIIGLLITLTNGVRCLVFLNVERLVRWGTGKAVVFASLLLATSMFLVRNASDFNGFALPLIIYGVGSGIMTPVVLDFIAKRTPVKALGTAMGVHEGIYGVGMFFGPFIGGVIADSYGTTLLYTILVGVSLVVIPLVLKMTSDKTKNSNLNPLNS
ncbi:MAG: MFS transporter, partial [Candidatus Bathyarchaeota archaeon]|nr:MFS transporter [Candidatus Bathyarchaeota archaeon]